MISRWLNDIGWAASRVYGHAHLLTIDRDDPQGSAAVDKENELDKTQPIVDEDDRLDDDDLDDQPRGKRTDKSARAYDDLKSERDRLKAETEKKDRLLQDMAERVNRLEQGRETRQTVNDRADEERQASEQRGRDLAAKVKALDRSDPEYTEKVYSMLVQAQEDIAKRTSLQTSAEVVNTRLTMDEQRSRAQRAALDELERQGLTKDDLPLLRAMAAVKQEEDPGWDRRMPNAEQIPHLVSRLKERLVKTTRNDPSFREEKTRHRETMGGVIGEGSRSGRSARNGGDDDGQQGPGSILADLARLRTSQRTNTTRMLRTSDR